MNDSGQARTGCGGIWRGRTDGRIMKGGRRAPHCRSLALVAACCMLGLGSSWNVPAASAQSAVEHAAPGESVVLREAATLARRILERQSDERVLDEASLDRLGREIAQVLGLIRHRYPAMAEITVPEPPRGLILDVDGIAERWSDPDAGIVPRTGHAAFDNLNATPGARVLDVWPSFKAVLLHFPERTNLDAARKAYEAIPGVAHAALDESLIDGPDIAASKTHEGAWLVAMRDAWGDCPAGCTDEHFFTVRDGHAERMDENAARRSPEFRTLEAMTTSGWSWR